MPQNEDTLRNDERLFAGQFLRSKNGLFHAMMQDDGNFVVYRGDWFKTKHAGYEQTALWSVFPIGHAPGGGTGYHIYMQQDGNLCIYRQDPHAVVYCNPQTNATRDQPGCSDRVLILSDDGRLDIRGIWDSNASDSYGEVEFEQVEYIMDPPPRITAVGSPGSSMGAIAHNDTPREQSATLSVSYTQTTSTSWTVSTSLTIGASTEIEAGIPGVVDGKVTASAEFTMGFEWNKTTTESKQSGVSLPVVVPPNCAYVAKCTWQISSLQIPYRVLGKIKFAGYPEKLPVHVEGIYNGVVTWNVEVRWKDVTKGAGVQPSTAAISPDEDGWILAKRFDPQASQPSSSK